MGKKLQHFYRESLDGLLRAIFSIGVLTVSAFFAPSRAEPVNPNEVPKEREIHNTFSGDSQKETVLDATNPFQLLNRLRQAQAMQDATSPSDAIDQALKALDSQETENSF